MSARRRPDFDSVAPLNRESTASLLANRIRAEIMRGTFPPGSQMIEAELSAHFQVSRGPVREALQRLVQEGLLRSEPHRGLFVIALSSADIADIYRVRVAVERTAVLALLRRDSDKILKPLEDVLQRMEAAAWQRDWPTVADLDLDFHLALVAASGSQRLERVLRTLLVEIRMCLASLEDAYSLAVHLAAEHRQLFEAIQRRDEPEALRLVQAHMDTAVRDLTEHYGEGRGQTLVNPS
jgi:DNA-binding GntR family transcriptional regulator